MKQAATVWNSARAWWFSAAAGAGLGIIFRLIFDANIFNGKYGQAVAVMTLAYLVLVPIAMGYFCVDRYLRKTPPERIFWLKWMFLPWVSVLLMILVAAAVNWEGWICLLMGSPIMLFFAWVGGIIARIVTAWYKESHAGTATVLALPILLLAIEVQIPAPPQIRTVNTGILIHAPAQVVWDNIKSVRAIRSDELPRSWVQQIGFPKPVAATLSHDGVGGVRQASFTGGLMFTETVNQWQPNQDLRFSIRANTDAIPATTLDEHVTIGGPFFDVLEGEYRLEPSTDGVLLHLSSRERLSTHFNAYAGAWTDAVMRAIQAQILDVIRKRCEMAAAGS